ncbi:hypothetical protein L1987_81491 [Smallanthus sonchifolius]|uniref:Uncharacterized protein n=1 Tax=Smallanthus sonchifolius TaxID=185202 RepID=A0ACB8YR74_9ASTR|nr:hypothetical protein L1987_81491 [Smallanthus sonchifolius]
MFEAEWRRMQKNLNRLMHHQLFTRRRISDVPENEWRRTDDNLKKRLGLYPSSNDEGFKVYFKGLVSAKTSCAGVGVAICDTRDRCVFELRKQFLIGGDGGGGGGPMDGDVLIGKDRPTNKMTVTLVDSLILIQRKIGYRGPFLMRQSNAKCAYKLAKEAIAATEQCTICLEQICRDNMFSVNKCLHRYCHSCMNKHVKAKLLQGQLPECPHEKCKSKLEIKSCKKFLNKNLYDIMRSRIKEASIPPTERVYCPFSKCSFLMSKDELQHAASTSSQESGKRKCPKCHRLFCVNCKVPWHDKYKCSDYIKRFPDQFANEGATILVADADMSFATVVEIKYNPTIRNPQVMPSFHSHFNKIVNSSIKTLKPVASFHSNHNQQPFPSPSRIQKLIASQADPLVAKEIFDLASNSHPNFHHSYATFQTLILKLGRSRHFSLMSSLLSSLKSDSRYTVPPSLFTHIIRIIAYHLFGEMPKRDVVPNVESYRILMQGLCRKSQVNSAVDLLEDILNKGFVPDSLTYTTVLNSLCRKKKLREAYKLLCRMKVKGCSPDIVHYNTVILGFCRENRAHDACKVLEDMDSNGCLPNLVSYQTLVGGLCSQGLYDETKSYLDLMISKGFSPHVSVWHVLIIGLCNVGKIDEACSVLEGMLKSGEAPHVYTWMDMISRICEVEIGRLEEVLKVEIEPHTRIVEAGVDLQEYLVKKGRANDRFKSRREKNLLSTGIAKEKDGSCDK